MFATLRRYSLAALKTAFFTGFIWLKQLKAFIAQPADKPFAGGWSQAVAVFKQLLVQDCPMLSQGDALPSLKLLLLEDANTRVVPLASVAAGGQPLCLNFGSCT